MSGRALRILGGILLLGGVAHLLCVAHLYSQRGFPDANRILIDGWIAIFQWLAGGLFWTSARAKQRGQPHLALASFAALTVIGFQTPMLPILIHRAPPHFIAVGTIYLFGSGAVLAMLHRRKA